MLLKSKKEEMDMSNASGIGGGNHVRPLAKDFSLKLMHRFDFAGRHIASLNVDKRVIKLRMEYGSTKDKDLRGIIEKFKSYKSLDKVQELGLSCSHLTGEGIKLLANFSNLKKVNLICSFEIKGKEFDNLKNLKTLEWLELACNHQIGAEGTDSIEFLKELPNLKYVNLMATGIAELKEWTDFRGELLKNNPLLQIIA
jgi:hypothetical protein